MTDYVPQITPFTGRKMLLVMCTFFAVIIAVNASMLTMAVKTFGGLVVGNSYVASQRFNADIAAARAQPIHGWSLEIAPHTDTIELDVRDRDGSALQDLNLSLEIARPTHDRSTITVPLTSASNGMYTGPATLEPGQWLATVTTEDGQTRSFTFIHKRPAP